MVKYVETPARAVAGARNLVAARAASAARPRTAAQTAAAQHNIAAAHAATRGQHRVESPAQAAAARRALGIARTHAGHHSPRQLAADRRNLAKARAARHHNAQQHSGSSAAPLPTMTGWHAAGSVGSQALALLRG